jgi:hypothetical protein
MIFACLKNNVIENIIEAEQSFIDSVELPYDEVKPLLSWQKIGMEYSETPPTIINIQGAMTTINTEIVIPVAYEVLGEVAPVNKSVEVLLDGVSIGEIEIVEGVGNIEFISEEVGTFVISIEGASCEVIVNEN